MSSPWLQIRPGWINVHSVRLQSENRSPPILLRFQRFQEVDFSTEYSPEVGDCTNLTMITCAIESKLTHKWRGISKSSRYHLNSSKGDMQVRTVSHCVAHKFSASRQGIPYLWKECTMNLGSEILSVWKRFGKTKLGRREHRHRQQRQRFTQRILCSVHSGISKLDNQYWHVLHQT